MQLLLLSNSTNAGENYLDYCHAKISGFLHAHQVHTALFIPFAGITIPYDEYEKKVAEQLDVALLGVHRTSKMLEAIEQAQAIIVGGGNTFELLWQLQMNSLIEPIRQRIMEGIPYVGWSAGANLACPTISTTNDMPIVQPPTFEALNLVPFQINPHYTDAHPAGHAGETREQRIEEYTLLNPESYVVGLREGSMLQVKNEELLLIGEKSMRLFGRGNTPKELNQQDDLSFLLRR